MSAGDRTPGRRVREKEPHEFEPGDYGRWAADGDRWSGRTPNGHLCNLSGHEVVEHEDGTITAAPSIAVSRGPNEVVWHGYLERGVWREA